MVIVNQHIGPTKASPVNHTIAFTWALSLGHIYIAMLIWNVPWASFPSPCVLQLITPAAVQSTPLFYSTIIGRMLKGQQMIACVTLNFQMIWRKKKYESGLSNERFYYLPYLEYWYCIPARWHAGIFFLDQTNTVVFCFVFRTYIIIIIIIRRRYVTQSLPFPSWV